MAVMILIDAYMRQEKGDLDYIKTINASQNMGCGN